MSRRHATPLRGLTQHGIETGTKGGQARFGRMFPHSKEVPAATYGTPQQAHESLMKLGGAMVAEFDPPKDGKDAEESNIPALFTYFGQFVDHDLTFDPEGSFQKEKDPDATVDFRTPAFDLDNVYGRGPGDQPYFYGDDGKSLLLGDPLTLGHQNARDLQRNAAGRAIIGDPRNDENAIVSQLQGLFLRFHNRMVAENAAKTFQEIQEMVRWHYQYVVVNDFMRRLVSDPILQALKTNGAYDKAKLKYFKVGPSPFMPVEFSIAAYRLGHSMVRPGYRLNDATLVPIFPNPPGATSKFPEGLTGFRRMISDWGIDWGRFIDIDIRSYDAPGDKGESIRQERLQFAYRIDTSLVDPLGNLPPSVVGNAPPSLAARNLLRALEFGLPSGQSVAKAMGIEPLKDEDIKIGQGVTDPEGPLPDITKFGDVFKGNCPLWTYILAEAMHYQDEMKIPVKENVKVKSPQLGPVGGGIVAEVFLGLLFSDSLSYLSREPKWTPKAKSDFGLKDFVTFALG